MSSDPRPHVVIVGGGLGGIAGARALPSAAGVFAVGYTAHLEQDGRPLPGVAQPAIRQGRYVGELIASRVAGLPAPPPFRYFDKGNLAVIGRNFAIFESSRVRVAGFVAWVIWASIRLAFLPMAGSRFVVFAQWLWTYLTRQLGSRVILEHRREPPARPDTAP